MPISAKDEKEPKKMATSAAVTNNGCSIRCSVEKRSYCRELQKWSKNLLYMVGLENVAKKFTDKKSWIKISPFIEPGPSKSKSELSIDCIDWNPEEHCPICKGKGKEKSKQPMENHKSSESKQNKVARLPTPNITSPTDILFESQSSSTPRNTLENITYPSVPYYDLSQAYLSQLMLHWSKLGPFTLPPPIGPLLLPFAPPPNLLQSTQSPTLDTSGLFQSSLPALNTAKLSSVVAEEPLDLSVKPTITNTAQTGSKSNKTASSANNIPQTPAQISNASKKAYSQADLEAAVQDIRCGKLGTRRASVVYGIPRSTLRNKIYKLEATEEGGSSRKKKKPTNGASSTTRVAPPPAAAVAVPVTTAEKSPAGSLTSEESSENSSAGLAYSQSAATEKLVNELAKYKATSISNCWTDAGRSLSDLEPLDSSAELSQSSLVKSVVEDAAHSALVGQLKTANSNKRPASNQLGKSPDIVKRPRSASSRNDSPTLDRFDPNRKVRPKRGQYRRYDKNALAEAVQSVRRGEMSVHRAGSYYGVPHSTLEYKVKERNLLRPKKRDQTRQNRDTNSSGPSSSAAAASASKSNGGGGNRRRTSLTKQESAASDSPMTTTGNDEARAYSPISREILNCLKTSPSSAASSSTNDVTTIWRLPTFSSDKSRPDSQPVSPPERRDDANGNDDGALESATDVFPSELLQTNVQKVVPILN